MTQSIGAVSFAGLVIFACLSATASAAAAQGMIVMQKPPVKATGFSARQRYQQHHDTYRAYYPHYYGRPYYYSPNPSFLPLPPLWGYGWEWW
jgi:hypothetical protein